MKYVDSSEFEHLLLNPKDDKDEKKNDKGADYWDSRAEGFMKHVGCSANTHDSFIFDFVKSKNMLPDEGRVLDIGCGVGRHAGDFAKMCKNYKGVDISPKMLEFAVERMANAGIDNTEFEKVDWKTIDKKYDIVFSSMVPIINSVDDLKTYTEKSKGYCIISRFLEEKDEISDILGIPYANKMHNKPEVAYAILNMLWALGYYPEFIVDESEKIVEDELEEVLKRYDLKTLPNSVQHLASEGTVKWKVRYKKAIIVWKVKQA